LVVRGDGRAKRWCRRWSRAVGARTS
jgi:hypothetical protein